MYKIVVIMYNYLFMNVNSRCIFVVIIMILVFALFRFGGTILNRSSFIFSSQFPSHFCFRFQLSFAKISLFTFANNAVKYN